MTQQAGHYRSTRPGRRRDATAAALEALAEEGLTPNEIARRLDMDRHYASALYRRWKGETAGDNTPDNSMPTAEQDSVFAFKVRREGGLPRVEIVCGCAVWLTEDDRPWKHYPPQRKRS